MCCVKHRPRQASSQTCNVQEDECRPPALFLSLPPQVWKIAFIQPLNQKLTLPSFTAATDGDRAHLTSTNRSPRWSRGKEEGGVKDKQARRGEISESVRRWLINKVVGWGVRRLDTADWYSTEIACHSRSASLHNRCWSGRAEGSLYPWECSELKTLTCDITSCQRSTAVGGRWKFLGSWRCSFFPLCYLERLWRFWSQQKWVTMLCHYLPPPQPHLTFSPSVYLPTMPRPLEGQRQ